MEKPLPQVALNWLIWKENVVAIPKATNKDHIKENFGAMGWRLSEEEYEAALRCI